MLLFTIFASISIATAIDFEGMLEELKYSFDKDKLSPEIRFDLTM